MPNIVWKFVDQPVASPTTLFDMNRQDHSVIIDFDAPFNVDSPVLRRNFSSSALQDGALLTSSAFENRVLEFTLALSGTFVQKAALLAQLDEQMAQPENLLMYQIDPSLGPVFFRTMQADEYKFVHKGGRAEAWRVTCQVFAEPFAIGPRVDHTVGAVITNDPASGANPARLDLSGILGDVPSPAFIRTTSPGFLNHIYIAQRTRYPTELTHFKQAETFTMGSDTAVWTAPSDASGAGNNMTATTFATVSPFSDRLTNGVFTATDPRAFRGRYRVMARIGTGTNGSIYTIAFRHDRAETTMTSKRVQHKFASTTPRRLLDLGILAWPPYDAPAQVGHSRLEPAIEPIDIDIAAQRNSSAGNLDFDYVYLLPADERMCIVGVSSGNSGGFLILDGPNDSTYMMPSGTTAFGATRTINNDGGLAVRLGSIPELVPGKTNRWHILQAGASSTATLTMDVSYWPRWKEVPTP